MHLRPGLGHKLSFGVFRAHETCLVAAIISNTLVWDELINSLPRNLASRNEKHRYIVWYKMRFDILNRLGVDHECDRQTDRQTDRTAISNSTVYAKDCTLYIWHWRIQSSSEISV